MVRRTLPLKHNGAVLRVPVRFDSAAHVGEFYTRMAAAIKWEHGMQKHQSDAMAAAYGRAIMSVYRLVFGDQWAQQIEAWYGDDVADMVTAVNGFIAAYVVPDVNEASARNREKARRDFIRARKKAVRASS